VTVNYKKIRDRIQTLWPKCKNVWLSDPKYSYPTIEQVKNVISNDHTERLKMRGYKFDCDDFSLQLSAAVSRYVGQSDSEAPWPFGQVKGHTFQHLVFNTAHNCNICLLEDRILIIEPQTDAIYDAHSQKDKVYYVAMP